MDFIQAEVGHPIMIRGSQGVELVDDPGCPLKAQGLEAIILEVQEPSVRRERQLVTVLFQDLLQFQDAKIEEGILFVTDLDGCVGPGHGLLRNRVEYRWLMCH